MQAVNNLKQIGVATINYAANFGALPPAGCPKPLHPGLSWRVAILPFIDEDLFFNQFHLDEPWDSPHNKGLLPMMPKVFAAPGANDPPGMTRYRVFVGKGTAFEKLQLKVRAPGDVGAEDFEELHQKILEELREKILIVEAADPVPWTKPEAQPPAARGP
jgi:hypothetical protein